MFNSESLKALRVAQGKTQQEFADAIGVTRELLSKMESGKKPISKATQILLRDYSASTNTVNIVPTEKAPDQYSDRILSLIDAQIALLNRQADKDDKLIATADAAILAVNNSNKLVTDIIPTVERTQENLTDVALRLETLRDFVSDTAAGYLQRTTDDIDAQLHRAYLAKKKQSKKGTPASTGRTHSVKV